MSPEENGHLNDYVAQEHGMKIIDRCAETKDASLSLSSKRLSEVPGSLLKLDHLQYLYLDGNQLRALPGNFFDCLRELSWLDLRNNELVSLPTAYVGRHKALRHLLLEGNRLETLPLELGLVSTLQGLNIANNPLKFPPADVIQKGVKEVLRFFRSILHVKSTAHSEKSLNGSEKGAAGAGNAVECSLEDEASAAALASQDGLARQRPSTAGSAKSEVTGQAAALHAVDSRGDLKLTKAARLRRSEASADRRLSRKKETNPLGLPSDELIDEKLTELGKKTRERARNESVDKLLQKQRNAEILSEFRDKAKNLQRKKEVEKRIKGKLDYVEAVDSAPFDIDPEHMQMISNEDRIKVCFKLQPQSSSGTVRPSSLPHLARWHGGRRRLDPCRHSRWSVAFVWRVAMAARPSLARVATQRVQRAKKRGWQYADDDSNTALDILHAF